MLPRRARPGSSVNARCRSSGKDGTEVVVVTFDRTVTTDFAFACGAVDEDGAARAWVGLNGEGARAGDAREVEMLLAALRL